VKTGNVTISIVLIVFGVFIGLTLIPGLCHLVGTSKAKKGMSFNNSDYERRNYDNERYRTEPPYYRSQPQKRDMRIGEERGSPLELENKRLKAEVAYYKRRLERYEG